MTERQDEPRKKWRRTRGFIRRRFDVIRWISWPEVKQSTHNLGQMFKDIFKIERTKRVETFNEAMDRLHLSADQVLQRQKHLAMRAKLFFLFALVVLSYAYFLIVYRNVIGGGLCTMLVSGPLFALSFRDSFWAYQIRRKRLGCSMEEWFRDNFGIAKLWFRD